MIQVAASFKGISQRHIHTVNELNQYSTHDKENRLLAEVYTVSLLVPNIPKPILIPYGEQGSAKSTFQEFIKSLIDPCGALREFMNSKKYWKGTATELLNELENTAEALKIKIKNNRQWPSAPNSLSRKLNEVRTNLREVGITIERPVDTKTNTILVEIIKISPESPLSPEDPLENTGYIAGDLYLTQKQIPPEIPSENPSGTCAQNEQTGDIGHIGDVIHISTIHKLGHSDTWGCKCCNQKGDKWFMQKHICRGQK